MATELKVPTLGMDMEEATIVRWLVEEGAEVEAGEEAAATRQREGTRDRPVPASAESENGRKVRASPAARRMAAEMGVPIESVTGSGADRRGSLSGVFEGGAQNPARG